MAKPEYVQIQEQISLLYSALSAARPVWPGLETREPNGPDYCPGVTPDGTPCTGGVETISHDELDVHTWSAEDLSDPAAPVFDGHFDWSGDGQDAHLFCSTCQSEWQVPTGTDFS